jgi:hypothetical protein
VSGNHLRALAQADPDRFSSGGAACATPGGGLGANASAAAALATPGRTCADAPLPGDAAAVAQQRTGGGESPVGNGARGMPQVGFGGV